MLTLHSIDVTRTTGTPDVRTRRSPFARTAQALLEAAVVLLLAIALSTVAPASGATEAAPAVEVTIEVDDSPAARALAEELPAALVFDDRMGAAVVAEDVAVASVPASEQTVTDYRAGDVAWWPAHRELVVFAHDGSGVGEAELVRIGTVRSGLADLQSCVRDCGVTMSFEADGS